MEGRLILNKPREFRSLWSTLTREQKDEWLLLFSEYANVRYAEVLDGLAER